MAVNSARRSRLTRKDVLLSPEELATLTDEQLDTLRVSVLTEQERRANVAAIPAQIASLKQTFLDGGGDPADLP